jgi:hypothetical protein
MRTRGMHQVTMSGHNSGRTLSSGLIMTTSWRTQVETRCESLHLARRQRMINELPASVSAQRGPLTIRQPFFELARIYPGSKS